VGGVVFVLGITESPCCCAKCFGCCSFVVVGLLLFCSLVMIML